MRRHEWLTSSRGRRGVRPYRSSLQLGDFSRTNSITSTCLTIPWWFSPLWKSLSVIPSPVCRIPRRSSPGRSFALAQGLLRAPLAHRPPADSKPDIDSLPVDLEKLSTFFRTYLNSETCLMLKWVALLHDVGKPATRRLNRNKHTEPFKMQFLGHEVFGLHMLDNLLDHLYPVAGDKRRISYLIRNHHDHHMLLFNRYKNEKQLGDLKNALDRSDRRKNAEIDHLLDHFSKPGRQDFPLLTLHGFADLVACRGPGNDTPMNLVAQVDLMLLTLWLRWNELKQIIDENNRRLSRTHSGTSDTSTSTEKRPLLLEADALSWKVMENQAKVCSWLWAAMRQHLDRPPTAKEIQLWLLETCGPDQQWNAADRRSIPKLGTAFPTSCQRQ